MDEVMPKITDPTMIPADAKVETVEDNMPSKPEEAEIIIKNKEFIKPNTSNMTNILKENSKSIKMPQRSQPPKKQQPVNDNNDDSDGENNIPNFIQKYKMIIAVIIILIIVVVIGYAVWKNRKDKQAKLDADTARLENAAKRVELEKQQRSSSVERRNGGFVSEPSRESLSKMPTKPSKKVSFTKSTRKQEQAQHQEEVSRHEQQYENYGEEEEEDLHESIVKDVSSDELLKYLGNNKSSKPQEDKQESSKSTVSIKKETSVKSDVVKKQKQGEPQIIISQVSLSSILDDDDDDEFLIKKQDMEIEEINDQE